MGIVGAWLAMNAFASDEVEYNLYAETITHVYPANGGQWNTDGDFVQDDTRLDWSWPQALPGLARSNGHKYAPVVGCGGDPFGVLDKPEIWQTCLDNLINTAQGRFDAPWHGVMFDIEGITAEYKEAFNSFLAFICNGLHDAGFEAYGWFLNCLDPRPMMNCQYAWDWGHYGNIFDRVHIGESYGAYGTPNPEMSISPLWWIEEGFQKVQAEGLPASKTVMDLRLSARYIFGEEPEDKNWIAYSAALAMIQADGASLDWVDHFPEGAAHPESTLPGSVQECRSELSNGDIIWTEGHRSTTARLQLASKYGIDNLAVLRPSLSNPDSWIAIAQYREAMERGGNVPIPIHYGPRCSRATKTTRICG